MSKDTHSPSTDPSDISALRERVRSGNLRQEDLLLLDRLLGTLLNLIGLIERKNASIKRLKRWLFGPGSDTRTASNKAGNLSDHPTPEQSDASTSSIQHTNTSDTKPPHKGHGRLPASAYKAAQVVRCSDPILKAGQPCPDRACRGHLYDTNSPSILIRLTGQPLVGATCYEQDVLRCSACQTRYTAPLPEGVLPQKYEASADVAICLAKYSAGLPFHRLARLQSNFGVPVAQSVLFSRCEAVADAVLPLFIHLKQLAAQGQLLYADDTGVKILSCLKENKQLSQGDRRGLQTTGIVARLGDHHIALYSSGRRHAGENIAELLRNRREGLSPAIQMGDALSRNWSGEFETIVSKCLAHARRQFIELEAAFPQECCRVLDSLSQVYRFDAQTRAMSGDERLKYHQQHSRPVMETLREWIEQQFAEHKVEPNSRLGKALTYLTNHWAGLSRFLTVASAPLDNNVVERALRLAVLHRKNALFYKTEHGAAVGDILMSLIETCRMNSVSAWDYLLALVCNAGAARCKPQEWLPCNYQQSARKTRAA